MFPREGKFNHFAQFEIIGGKLLPDGKYQRPTVALLCNFPPPSADKPSLLTHTDVETLFHEFGHALHAIVTRAKYSRFAGTNVPGDFVEAPSQMLQNWVWDKKVLDTFAADYRDPSKKIPAEIIQKMKDAKLATAGVLLSAAVRLRFARSRLARPASGEPALRLRRDFESDFGKSFSPDRSEHDHGRLTSATEWLRCRLLRLRLGRCDCRRHGDGFREGARMVIWTSRPECDCATKSTSRAIRATSPFRSRSFSAANNRSSRS